MKSNYSFLAAVGALCFAAACSKFEQTPSLVVINVLSPEHYKDAHIKGSINVPFDEVEQYAKKLDPKTEVVFYCSNYMCSASGMSAQTFKKLGFTHVWAYEGGMAEWFQLGLPTEGPVTMQVWRTPTKTTVTEHPFPVITAQELQKKMELHKIL